jgi:pyruvate formate lyase activating enzyme
MAGKAIHPKNLAEILLRDMVLYNNTGGATFSGGEPMLQTAFLITMLKRMKKEGINTAVDTAGCVSWTIIEAVSSYTDYFLYDVKAINSATHVKYTGRDNTLILDNLKALAKSGKVVIWIRVPLIRGINDNNEDIVQLGDFLRDLPNIGRLDILPYHNYGLYKSHSLGFQAEEFQRPDEDRLTEIKAILEQKDLTVHIN